MIVPAMTVSEIQKELANDYDNCLARVTKNLNKYRREIIKSSRFPIYFKPIDHVTPSKNNFILFIEAQSKKDAQNPVITFVGYYLKPEGIYAAMVYPVLDGRKKIAIYPPHFFERYKERFLHEDLGTLDTIKLYFKSNPSNILELSDENLFRGKCAHGFVFGEKLNDSVEIIKTFISSEMLKGDQKLLSEFLIGELDELNKSKSSFDSSKNPYLKLIACC